MELANRLSLRDKIAILLAALLVLAPLSTCSIERLIDEKWFQSFYKILSTNESTAWLTLAALIGQLFILFRQARIMKRQQDIMGRQADISERTMTIVHEPYALIEAPEFLQPTRARSAAWPPSAEYMLIFHGKTPATLRAVYDRLLFCDGLPDPAKIKFESAFPNTIQRDGSVRHDHAMMSLDVAQTLEDEIFERVHTSKSYFLVGRVVYDDIFGNQHEFGYCYNASSHGGVGSPHGGAAYNYRRISKPKDRI